MNYSGSDIKAIKEFAKQNFRVAQKIKDDSARGTVFVFDDIKVESYINKVRIRFIRMFPNESIEKYSIVEIAKRVEARAAELKELSHQKRKTAIAEKKGKTKGVNMKKLILSDALPKNNLSDILDLRPLDFKKSLVSSVTGGMLFKAYLDGKFYKLSSFSPDIGFFGMESVIEEVCSNYLVKLGFNCVVQKCILGRVVINDAEYITTVSVSEDYNKANLAKVPFDIYCGTRAPLSVIRSNGWFKDIERMFIADYLICNRDRHGANIEVLSDNSLSPLFDHGNSLLGSRLDREDQIQSFNVSSTFRVNNFIGYSTLEENLSLVEHPIRLPIIDYDSLFDNVKRYCSSLYIAKTIELLKYRREYYDVLFFGS